MNTEYVDNETIWHAADEFRASNELTGFNMPPIDVMYVADVRLQFDIVEIEGMFEDLGMDAAVVPTEKALYVDRYALDQWERKSHWIERRLRFTVAHEFGHFVMHERYIQNLRFSDVAGFKRWNHAEIPRRDPRGWIAPRNDNVQDKAVTRIVIPNPSG